MQLKKIRNSVIIKQKRGNHMKKCDYCAKEITYFEQYCCEECERKTLQYHLRNERFSKLFYVINTICVFGIPVGLFIASFSSAVGIPIAAGSCLVLGLMLILLPFPTESMIRKHKLQKAIKISRIFGGCVIGLGVLIVGLVFVLKR